VCDVLSADEAGELERRSADQLARTNAGVVKATA
jgi:hypothetical protein